LCTVFFIFDLHWIAKYNLPILLRFFTFISTSCILHHIFSSPHILSGFWLLMFLYVNITRLPKVRIVLKGIHSFSTGPMFPSFHPVLIYTLCATSSYISLVQKGRSMYIFSMSFFLTYRWICFSLSFFSY
jgi:hypothetical protein